jgi:tRNA splicing ligase
MYQIAAQIHTSGHKIGELFQLKDAVTPEIHEFTKDMTSGLFNQLVEATEEFTSRVTFVKQQKAKGIQGEELEALITEYEPEADSLESTHQFLKERFKDLPENIPMEGDVDTYEMARDYLKYGQTKREANEEQALIKNKLMQIMVNAKTKVIDFGEAGRVSNHSKFSVSKRLAND